MISYPLYTNFIASKNISNKLSQWEELQKESSAGEAEEAEENKASQESESAAEEIPEDAKDDPVMDMSQDG